MLFSDHALSGRLEAAEGHRSPRCSSEMAGIMPISRSSRPSTPNHALMTNGYTGLAVPSVGCRFIVDWWETGFALVYDISSVFSFICRLNSFKISEWFLARYFSTFLFARRRSVYLLEDERDDAVNMGRSLIERTK